MSSPSRIPLSPLDQFMPRTYTRVFLTFPVANNDFQSLVSALNNGLAKTCSQLPYLRGQVSQSEERGQLEIIWSPTDETPQIQFKETPDDMPSYATMKAQGMPLRFFTESICPVGVRPDHSKPGASAPALVVGYVAPTGGLLLCVCVHHYVMDGTGVGELISLLASNTSGSGAVFPQPDEPLHRTSRLKTVLDSFALQSSDKDLQTLLQLHPEFNMQPPTPPASMPPCNSRIFTFSGNAVKSLGERLTTMMTASKSTANLVLFALLWSSISRVRLARLRSQHNSHGNDSEVDPAPPSAASQSKLGFAINGRRHLGNSFNDSMYPYLGNVNLFGLAELPIASLISLSEASLAPTINAIALAIARISPAHIAEVIELVDLLPDIRTLRQGWTSFHRIDLTMTSWSGLAVYGADFGAGLGRAEFCRVPCANFDGLAIVLPRRRGGKETSGEEHEHDEGIEVVVMLREEDLESLESDVVLQAYLK